jgi:large subunit ribosomal protein L13
MKNPFRIDRKTPIMENKRKAIFAKTPALKPQEVNHEWYLLDATGLTLGRLASEIAKILRGKHKPSFTPDVDCGAGVIVLNAGKVKVTGNKKVQKLYRYHTGYVGNLREIHYCDMVARKPGFPIEHAVKGMMPRNAISRQQLKRLRVFAGTEHDLVAQKPIVVNF